MPCCSAVGCPNKNYRKKTSGVTFHRFPKNEVLRDKWIAAMGVSNWTPGISATLCSTHFSEKDIDRTSLCCVRLREGAVPSIFPTIIKKEPKSKKSLSSTVEDEYSNDKSSEKWLENQSNPTSPLQIYIKQEEMSEEDEEILLPNSLQDTVIDQKPDVTSMSCMKTLELTRLKMKIDQQKELLLGARKKIKHLNQVRRRLIKRSEGLHEVINQIKIEKKSRQNEMFCKATSKSETEILRVLNGLEPKDTYSAEVRSFVLKLHSISPSAYKYVNKTFNNILPHTRTVRKWHSESTNNEDGKLQDSEYNNGNTHNDNVKENGKQQDSEYNNENTHNDNVKENGKLQDSEYNNENTHNDNVKENGKQQNSEYNNENTHNDNVKENGKLQDSEYNNENTHTDNDKENGKLEDSEYNNENTHMDIASNELQHEENLNNADLYTQDDRTLH